MSSLYVPDSHIQLPANQIELPDNPVGVHCVWTLKENGRVVARAKNVFTVFGLSALAGALSGGYTPPSFLVLDSYGTTLSGPVSPGQTTITTQVRVDITGDTQLVLTPNLSNQETVTFSSVTGTGPYTYQLTAGALQSHNAGDIVLRQTNANDTLATVLSEIQYDSVGAPNERMPSYAGYAQGSGNWVVQFYLTGEQALATFNYIGMADAPLLGTGNLHDHAVLGYTHTSGNDVEIDVSLTLSNV